MKEFNKLMMHLQSLQGDFEKFYDKENQAAGTRVRKGMMELRKMAQEIRLNVQEKKNSAKAKASKAKSKTVGK